MTDFLIDLGQALDQAAERIETGAPAPRRRLAVGSLVAVVACIALVGAVVVIASRGAEDVETAATLPRDTSLVGTLEILRRPASTADHGPEVRKELDTFNARPEDVRLIKLAPDGKAILVAGPMDSPQPRADAHDGAFACMYYPDVDGGGVTCHTNADVRAGRATARLGNHFHMLIPDGVASARLKWPDRTDTVPVENNFIESEGNGWPSTITWLDAKGETVPFEQSAVTPARTVDAPVPPSPQRARLSLLERPATPEDTPFADHLRKHGQSAEVAASARLALVDGTRSFWVYQRDDEICLVGNGTACTKADTAATDTPLISISANTRTTHVTVSGLIHDGPSEIVVHERNGTTRSVPVRNNVYVFESDGADRISWIGLEGTEVSHSLNDAMPPGAHDRVPKAPSPGP
jgi:hypothetical protein